MNCKCCVCKKTGCWSTKHTREKRRQAYDRHKSNQYVQDASSTAYSIFLANYEGHESFSDDEGDEDIRHRTNDESSVKYGDGSSADGFTKSLPYKVLEGILSNNTATIRVEGWVSRT
ncbi:hypothetical protein LY76DRAFT_651747 [Colletotrichum caudatum]|nr:hypothetical protein LY76DRAFT_651747 [Colletotrichum caudatum]